MTTDTYMTQGYRDVLYEKYKILGHIEFKTFDKDFTVLEDFLHLIKKDYFEPNERIIIEHVDTDYYLPEFPYGINLYNLVTAFRKVDIPLFTLLLFTNNFGISKELAQLAPGEHPTVIETFIIDPHWTENYQDVKVNADNIEMPALTMLGHNRSHRNVLYHFLKENNLLDQVAVTGRPE